METGDLSAIKAKQKSQKIQQLENKILKDSLRANNGTRHHNLANECVKLANLTGQAEHYEEAITNYSMAIFLYKRDEDTVDLRSHLKRALILKEQGKAHEAVSDLLVVLPLLDSDETVQNMVIASDIAELIAHDAIKADIHARTQGLEGRINAEIMLKIIDENCSPRLYAMIKKPLMDLFQAPQPMPEPAPALSRTQLLKIKEINREIESHISILVLSPNSSSAHCQIAGLYRELGDITESASDYRKAVEWYSKAIVLENTKKGYADPQTLGDRGKALVKIGDISAATADLVALLETPWVFRFSIDIDCVQYAIRDLIAVEAVKNHIQECIQNGSIDAERVLKNIGEHAPEMYPGLVEELRAVFNFREPAPALVSSSKPMTFSASPNESFLPMAAPAVATPDQSAVAQYEKAKKCLEEAQANYEYAKKCLEQAQADFENLDSKQNLKQGNRI